MKNSKHFWISHLKSTAADGLNSVGKRTAKCTATCPRSPTHTPTTDTTACPCMSHVPWNSRDFEESRDQYPPEMACAPMDLPDRMRPPANSEKKAFNKKFPTS